MKTKFFYRVWRFRWLWGAASIALSGFILFVSTRPAQALRADGYPEWGQWFDASGHFVGYLLLSIFLRMALEGDPGRSRPATRFKAVVGTVILVCVWGFFCEIIQFWIPDRGVQFLDFAANMTPAPISQFLLGFIIPKPLTGND